MSLIKAADGTRLFTQDLGTGDVVVLIAGFGLTHELWDRQVRVLSGEGRRVICVDQRGHGGSDAPLDGYEISQLVADLSFVLRQLEVDSCTVVGHSFGGQVAFGLAAAEADLVARLVLVGSNGVGASRTERFPFGRPAERLLDPMIDAEVRERVSSRAAAIRSGFGRAPDEQTVDWLLRSSLQMPSWAALGCYRSMFEADLVDAVASVSMPVLQVIGEDDPVHSAKGARWLNERLPDSRLVTLPACGHYPMLEAAEAFEAALLAFLDETR